MTLSDVLALVFGAISVFATVGVAFMFVGNQRANARRRRTASRSEDAVGGHESQEVLIGKLEERLDNQNAMLNAQP